MLNEDQRIDRSPDLVARVRKLREKAEKQMNRFTCVADYDVRYVQGHGSQPARAVEEVTATESNANQESGTDTLTTATEGSAGEES
jgi:hypothetical protein